MAFSNKEGVSVIVCCYNSAQRLSKTIEHLARQQVPNYIPWEVIVIDNVSTDDTGAVAQQLWQEYGQPTTLRIIVEKQAGLSFARHAGFTNARYEYCLFCDDDNWLDKSYVVIAFQTMKKDHQIGVLGGMGEAVCEIEPPEWFENNQSNYAVGPQSPLEGDITYSRGYVYGAASTYRKSVYLLLTEDGYKGFLTGREGNKMTAGDDSELCYNYVLKDYKIYYSTRLRFKHFIPANRLTKDYYLRLKQGFVHSRVVLMLYRYKINQEQMLYKKFLWWRELLSSIRYQSKAKDLYRFKTTLTYALIVNRVTFISALKYLREA